MTDSYYKCQRIYTLYDTVFTTDKGGITFINSTGGSAASFDIDLEVAHITGKTGICVDDDSSMHQGCTNEVGAKIKDTLGCFDKPVGMFLCGLSLEIKHGDLSTVGVAGNLIYPRVLLAGGQDHDGDGRTDPEMTCLDPIDCSQKCLYLERTSRHGAGAPPSCALCDQMCPSNVLSTITDLKDAIWEDILTVVRMVASCFGNHGTLALFHMDHPAHCSQIDCSHHRDWGVYLQICEHSGAGLAPCLHQPDRSMRDRVSNHSLEHVQSLSPRVLCANTTSVLSSQ